MLVRLLILQDAAPAAELCTQLGYPSSPEQVARRLGMLTLRSDQGLFGAEEAGRLVGWLHVQERLVLEAEPYAEVCSVVVGEGLRDSGVGSELLARAEAWAQGRGLLEVQVRSNVVRERTHAFYEARGYRRTKTSHVFLKLL